MEEQKKQLEEIRQLKDSYISCFTSASGKKVMADLEAMCFVNRTTYSPEEGKIYYNEGMRLVLVHIKNMLNMDINKLNQLIREEE